MKDQPIWVINLYGNSVLIYAYTITWQAMDGKTRYQLYGRDMHDGKWLLDEEWVNGDHCEIPDRLKQSREKLNRFILDTRDVCDLRPKTRE